MTDCRQISKGQHDAGAALNLALCKRNGFLVIIAAQNKDNLPRKIFETLIRPGNELRAALCRYLHTVGDFDVVSRECRGLI